MCVQAALSWHNADSVFRGIGWGWIESVDQMNWWLKDGHSFSLMSLIWPSNCRQTVYMVEKPAFAEQNGQVNTMLWVEVKLKGHYL